MDLKPRHARGFFYSLCLGRHRTERQSAALIQVGHDPPPSGSLPSPRPVASHRRVVRRMSTALAGTAAELIALAPDVIQASGTGPMAAVQQATRTVPIVFAQVPDPVNAGFVDSLARPGGNATGFSVFEEYGTSGKWLELLKEVAPQVTRVAVLRDPTIAAGIGQTGAIQSVAPSLGVQVSPVGVRDASEIERAIAAFGRGANGGLIVLGAPLAIMQRDLISTLAARHRLPAVYPARLSLRPAVSSPTGLIRSIRTGAWRATSIAFSRARSPPICRCRIRPSSSW
jgi:ABC transporter substrate binding protein